VTTARRRAAKTVEQTVEAPGKPTVTPVPTQSLGVAARAALARKYRQLLRWRLARDAAATGTPAGRAASWAGAGSEPATRPAMRALAEEFPGCLRELDRLGAPELARRAELLAEATTEPVAKREAEAKEAEAEAEEWIGWIWTYHRLVAAALVARSRRASPSPEDDALPPSFLAAFVRASRAPAGGRLSQVAIAFVARHSGATAADVAATLFPARPR
jgi:hypothetical protein